jgi:hypothetical protein
MKLRNVRGPSVSSVLPMQYIVGCCLIAPLIHNVTRLQHSRASGGATISITGFLHLQDNQIILCVASYFRTPSSCVILWTPYHPRPRSHGISMLIVRLERGHVAMLHSIPVLMVVLQRSLGGWHAYSDRFCHQRSFAGPCNYFIPRVRSQLTRLPVTDRLPLHSKENAMLN